MDTTRLPARIRNMRDPDDARDAAQDYLADLEAQYDDYVNECLQDGRKPLPFKVTL